MKFSTTLLLALVSLATSVTAVYNGEPLTAPAKRSPQLPNDDVHIFDTDDETPGSAGDWVVLVDDSDPRDIDQIITDLGGDPKSITDRYDNAAFKGFSAHMSRHCANRLQKFTNDHVLKAFEPQMTFQAAKLVTNNKAPWGLERVSIDKRVAQGLTQDVKSRTFKYESDDSSGEGVDIYIIDTGINTEHVEFEGRARIGFVANFVTTPANRNQLDENGHGTHCAGSAAGRTVGVSPKANIIGVKVLGSAGSGENSDILAGMDYIVKEHEKRRKQRNFKGSVMSMSIGSPNKSKTFDEAVQAVADRGIHVIIAAGNDAIDACNFSPSGQLARNATSTIISVGALDIQDQRAFFTNFGKCVDVYAPGVDVTSTWKTTQGRNNIVNTISGTSMACPHVAGIVAYYLGLNQKLRDDVASMKQLILQSSEKVKFSQYIAGDPQIVAGIDGVIGSGALEPSDASPKSDDKPKSKGALTTLGNAPKGIKDALENLVGGGRVGRVKREARLVHLTELEGM